MPYTRQVTSIGSIVSNNALRISRGYAGVLALQKFWSTLLPGDIRDPLRDCTHLRAFTHSPRLIAARRIQILGGAQQRRARRGVRALFTLDFTGQRLSLAAPRKKKLAFLFYHLVPSRPHECVSTGRV